MLNRSQWNRVVLLAASLLAFGLFWWVGDVFDIPGPGEFGASFVVRSYIAAAIGLIVTTLVFILAVLVGSLLAGHIRFDAGFFVAAIGLAALSWRGGPARYVVMEVGQSSVFLSLLMELALLAGMLGLAWSALWLLHRAGWLKGDEFRDGVEDVEDPLNNKLLALAMQVVVMIILVLLLAQSDEKAQVVAAVGVGGYLGTIASHYLFPVRPSVWFWAGPLITGGIGYTLGCFAGDDGLPIGLIPQPLARPLPLDYASIGVVGSILGYWMSRRWQRAREVAAEGVAA